jgi:hypothetical protein
MLELLGYILGFFPTLPPDDAACQATVCRQLLHGYLQAWGMADLETTQ